MEQPTKVFIDTSILHKALELIKTIQDSDIGQTIKELASDEVLNRDEAAQFLKISTWTLDNLRKSKGLPSVELSGVGGRILYRKRALIEWLIQHEQKSKLKKISSGISV